MIAEAVAHPVRAPRHRPPHRALTARDIPRPALDAILASEYEPTVDPLAPLGRADDRVEGVRAARQISGRTVMGARSLESVVDRSVARRRLIPAGSGACPTSAGASPASVGDPFPPYGVAYRGICARIVRSSRTAFTLVWKAERSEGVRSTSITRSTPARPSTTGTPT